MVRNPPFGHFGWKERVDFMDLGAQLPLKGREAGGKQQQLQIIEAKKVTMA